MKLQRNLAVALLALAMAPAALADWLVTTDGERIETQGAWREKGRMIVFELPSGSLASLRASEVDLEASRRATAEAAAPAPEVKPKTAPPREPRKATWVFTDSDFSPRPPGGVQEGVTPSEPGEAPGSAASEAPEARQGGLQVTTWQELERAESAGLAFTGTVRNDGDAAASSIRLTAELYDAEGEVIESRAASLTATTLLPGQSANFRVEFPGTFAYASVRFEGESQSLVAGPPPETGDDN